MPAELCVKQVADGQKRHDDRQNNEKLPEDGFLVLG